LKYLILAQMSQRTWDGLAAADEAAQEALGDGLRRIVADLTESGELLAAEGLDAPALAREVSLRGPSEAPMITDGPYAETKEVLAGYWLVDCVDLDRATEIATRLAQVPSSPPSAGVVIRRVL
jgi:hypothetical protein